VLLRVEIARFTLGGSGAEGARSRPRVLFGRRLRAARPACAGRATGLRLCLADHLGTASSSGSLHRACFAHPDSSLLL